MSKPAVAVDYIDPSERCPFQRHAEPGKALIEDE